MPLVIDSGVKLYTIETHAGKRLDVAGYGVSDRNPVHQWSAHDGANQRWYLDQCGADTYRIISRHSGRVLDLSGPDGPGSKVWQYAWAATDNQRWRLEDAGGGRVLIASAWDPDLAIDVARASKDDGAAVIVWTRHGGANQAFKLGSA